jgi:hypothetical protein
VGCRAKSDRNEVLGHFEQGMYEKSRLTTVALLSLTAALPAGRAAAQQTQQISYKVSAENSKYMQQQNIDVGDVPNHIVRSYELRKTFPNHAPIINGLKLVEEWNRGIADLVSGNGSGTQHMVWVMENGDKLFARAATVVQSVSGKLTATQVGNITGGTGKLAGMQGIVRQAVNFDTRTGFNESQIELDYSIGK